MGPNTRGGKRGNKKIYLKPSKKGGQIYQSDSARKSLRDAHGNDELGKRISKAYKEKVLAGEMTPQEAGRRNAYTDIDRIHDSYFEGGGHDKPREMKSGGEVCRGNGRAFQGKAKRVQVR